MSHSVPSDSSADSTFLVGTDLVEFVRHDFPIYAAPQADLMDAPHDAPPSYGAPLDRLFGEAGDVHVDASLPTGADSTTDALSIVADDPLVALASLTDSLVVSAMQAHAAAPELATPLDFNFGTDSHSVVHLHDAAGAWDGSGLDATFDFHAG